MPKQEDNIKLDHGLIHTTEDRNKRQAVLNTVTSLRFDKICGIPRLPEEMTASQERLCFTVVG
jgi:hypothetical protein